MDVVQCSSDKLRRTQQLCTGRTDGRTDRHLALRNETVYVGIDNHTGLVCTAKRYC